MVIHTPRMKLVCATAEMVSADLHDWDQLARLLGAPVGPNWPPPLITAEVMQRLKVLLDEAAEASGWSSWYWVLRNPRTVVGLSGFKSPPREGTVEIGYTLLPHFHGMGLGTEAVAGLQSWAFEHGAATVVAETLPELVASQRVLLKNGFHRAATASSPDVIRFECHAPTTSSAKNWPANSCRSP
jgi:[ribosomal protein S5]-alanine N-acetyltransferase